MNKLQFFVNGLINAPKNNIYRAFNVPLKPKMIWLNVTDRCNSRCAHCSIWKQEDTGEKPLSFGEIYTMLCSSVFDEIQTIVNTGGECSLRDDLYDIVLAEHKARPMAKIVLSTNGLLPERIINVVKRLKAVQVHVSVGISIDGIGFEHDVVRGVFGNFDRVDKLFKKLYVEGVDVSGCFVLSDLTINNVHSVQNYLNGFIEKVEFSVLQCNDAEYYHNRKQSNEEKGKMIEMVKSLDSRIVGGVLLKHLWLKWLQGKDIKFPCYALQTLCVVKSNGDIVPCLNMWDRVVGNVRRNTMREIWQSDSAREKRELVKKCKGCLNYCSVGESCYSAMYPYVEYLSDMKELIKELRS